MENQHLTYFKVENFKRFSSLELNDIGQFNIIVGDNNTGKTSLLEALLVDIGSFSAIAKRLEQRVPIYKNRSQFSFVELLEYFVTKEKSTTLLKINWKHSDTAFKLEEELDMFNLLQENQRFSLIQVKINIFLSWSLVIFTMSILKANTLNLFKYPRRRKTVLLKT